MRRRHQPRITIVQRSPTKSKRYCWQCLKFSHTACPQPDTTFNSEACPYFTLDPQPHCPVCHATGGTIRRQPQHKGNKTYTYYRIIHYDPTRKSKRRTCYLGKTLPPGLQAKLREGKNYAQA